MRASRRDNMKLKEKRERKLKAWILKYIRNLKKLPKLQNQIKKVKLVLSGYKLKRIFI